MEQKLNVLLPIETINREIDFKIVLASLLANKKYKIYIGQHDFLMKLVPELYGGIYIGKNIFTRSSNYETGEKCNLLRSRGFKIIYLHEEGAVFPGTEQNWKKILHSQYSMDFFHDTDIVCVWGETQRKMEEERKKLAPIVTTGHPRFDLYKKKWRFLYEADITELEKKYGKFVLINGNYGTSNHGQGVSHIFSEAGGYTVKNEKERMKRVGFYTHSTKQMLGMIQLTHELAIKFPSLNFVYRPHPSEDQNFYKIIFRGVGNIIVKHQGPVLPWILASKAIIHDGCTTALEATLAGKRVINYKVALDENFDYWLPNQMGENVSTVDEVAELVKEEKSFISNPPIGEDPQRVENLMFNFEGDSFEQLLGVIDQEIHSLEIKTDLKNVSTSEIQKKYWESKIKRKLHLLLKAQNAKEVAYHQNKFYGFDEKYIKSKFSLLAEDLKKDLYITCHNKFLVEIG